MSRFFHADMVNRLRNLEVFQSSILDAAKQVQRSIHEVVHQANGKPANGRKPTPARCEVESEDSETE